MKGLFLYGLVALSRGIPAALGHGGNQKEAFKNPDIFTSGGNDKPESKYEQAPVSQTTPPTTSAPKTTDQVSQTTTGEGNTPGDDDTGSDNGDNSGDSRTESEQSTPLLPAGDGTDSKDEPTNATKTASPTIPAPKTPDQANQTSSGEGNAPRDKDTGSDNSDNIDDSSTEPEQSTPLLPAGDGTDSKAEPTQATKTASPTISAPKTPDQANQTSSGECNAPGHKDTGSDNSDDRGTKPEQSSTTLLTGTLSDIGTPGGDGTDSMTEPTQPSQTEPSTASAPVTANTTSEAEGESKTEEDVIPAAANSSSKGYSTDSSSKPTEVSTDYLDLSQTTTASSAASTAPQLTAVTEDVRRQCGDMMPKFQIRGNLFSFEQQLSPLCGQLGWRLVITFTVPDHKTYQFEMCDASDHGSVVTDIGNQLLNGNVLEANRTGDSTRYLMDDGGLTLVETKPNTPNKVTPLAKEEAALAKPREITNCNGTTCHTEQCQRNECDAVLEVTYQPASGQSIPAASGSMPIVFTKTEFMPCQSLVVCNCVRKCIGGECGIEKPAQSPARPPVDVAQVRPVTVSAIVGSNVHDNLGRPGPVRGGETPSGSDDQVPSRSEQETSGPSRQPMQRPSSGLQEEQEMSDRPTAPIADAEIHDGEECDAYAQTVGLLNSGLQEDQESSDRPTTPIAAAESHDGEECDEDVQPVAQGGWDVEHSDEGAHISPSVPLAKSAPHRVGLDSAAYKEPGLDSAAPHETDRDSPDSADTATERASAPGTSIEETDTSTGVTRQSLAGPNGPERIGLAAVPANGDSQAQSGSFNTAGSRATSRSRGTTTTSEGGPGVNAVADAVTATGLASTVAGSNILAVLAAMVLLF